MGIRFVPHVPENELPPVNSAGEGLVQDFKKTWRSKPRFHVAKCIASFANTLGGTVFVGAAESGNIVRAYHPLSDEEASFTERAVDEAVRDLCRPRPIFSVERCPRGAGLVLAINIEPQLSGLIGVMLKPHEDESFGDRGWTFPVRSGSQTIYLDPDRIALHMIPSIRRIVLLLSRIDVDADVLIMYRNRANQLSQDRLKFVGFDEDDNVLTARDENSETHYGLDMIKTVFRSGEIWRIELDSTV